MNISLTILFLFSNVKDVGLVASSNTIPFSAPAAGNATEFLAVILTIQPHTWYCRTKQWKWIPGVNSDCQAAFTQRPKVKTWHLQSNAYSSKFSFVWCLWKWMESLDWILTLLTNTTWNILNLPNVREHCRQNQVLEWTLIAFCIPIFFLFLKS